MQLGPGNSGHFTSLHKNLYAWHCLLCEMPKTFQTSTLAHSPILDGLLQPLILLLSNHMPVRSHFWTQLHTSATPVGNALPQSQVLCQDMINYTKPSWWRRSSPGSTPSSRAWRRWGRRSTTPWARPHRRPVPGVRAGPRRGRHHALPSGLLPGVWAHLPLPG